MKSAMILAFMAMVCNVHAEDSLTLYLNSRKVMQFYEDHGNYVVVKRRNDVKAPHWNNWKAKMKYKGDKEKYYQKMSNHMYRQREVETTVLNMNAPMQLFHKKITPTTYVQYRNDVIGSPMHSDIVGLYLYSIPPASVREKEVVPDVEVSEPEKSVGVPLSLYDREDEVIREWENVPHLKIVSRRKSGQSIPFAIENTNGVRIPYENKQVPAGFQYAMRESSVLTDISINDVQQQDLPGVN